MLLAVVSTVVPIRNFVTETLYIVVSVWADRLAEKIVKADIRILKEEIIFIRSYFNLKSDTVNSQRTLTSNGNVNLIWYADKIFPGS